MEKEAPVDLGRGWAVEGLIPAATVVAVADLDDPPPDELIAAGVDVVLRLEARGELTDVPVRLSAHWRRGLMPGHEPPKPIWIRRVGHQLVAVPGGEAAA